MTGKDLDFLCSAFSAYLQKKNDNHVEGYTALDEGVFYITPSYEFVASSEEQLLDAINKELLGLSPIKKVRAFLNM